MTKQFFEVFPALKLEQKIQELFEQVTVEKVSAVRSRELIRVTIACDYLISKDTILKVEKEIKKQLFSAYPVIVKLYERFHLSGQYTPEKLMNAYRESILLELRAYSPVEYNLFRGADISFPSDGVMQLTVEETVIAHEKAAEVARILEKIMNERCGFGIVCHIDYKEKKTGKYKEEDDLMIARKVAQIAATAFGGESPITEEEAAPDLVEPKAMAPEKKDGKEGGSLKGTAEKGSTVSFRGEEKKGKKGRDDFKRAVKRSDNPDVIYGRDFEEEAIPIEEILGEMGEVVIRGKIIGFDFREIKNERTILMFDVTDFTDTMTIKLFAHNDQVAELKEGIKVGAFVKLKGVTTIDKFDNRLPCRSKEDPGFYNLQKRSQRP